MRILRTSNSSVHREEHTTLHMHLNLENTITNCIATMSEVHTAKPSKAVPHFARSIDLSALGKQMLEIKDVDDTITIQIWHLTLNIKVNVPFDILGGS